MTQKAKYLKILLSTDEVKLLLESLKIMESEFGLNDEDEEIIKKLEKLLAQSE